MEDLKKLIVDCSSLKSYLCPVSPSYCRRACCGVSATIPAQYSPSTPQQLPSAIEEKVFLRVKKQNGSDGHNSIRKPIAAP